MAINQTGPSPIDTLATGVKVDLGSREVRRDWLVERWQDTHARVKTVTHIATGMWYIEWPDLTSTPEAPTVANIVEVGISHWASLFGSVLPSLRVPVHASADRSQAKRGARKRERRLKELWKKSNVSELAANWGADYAGAGYALGMVWTDFGEPDPAKRDPYLMRLDPRHCYFTKDNLGNITELLVARKISLGELENMWKETNPDFLNIFSESKDEDVEEWFWLDKKTIFYGVVDMSKKGRDMKRHVVLTNIENPLGFIPAWEAQRPTFDGQRRGHFDQTIHILRTMQRLMVMTIHSTEQYSYPTTGGFDIANPEDFGPGQHVEYISPEGKLEVFSPSAHFDVKDLIGRLGEEARTQGALPQQLFGEPGASIVSARGINAAMGALDARLAVAHKQFEMLFGKLSGYLLAFDEVFCYGEKTILGDGSDDEASEKYNPERDVNGAWAVECTYGLGAGSDPANTEVRLNMHLGSGLISRETARGELTFLEDPEGEPLKQFRETMYMALQQGILARASEMGDPTLAAKALELLSKEDVDFESVVQELVEFIAAPPAPAAAGGQGALDAVQGAESLARGGIPGNAEQAPPGPALPPLGAVLGNPNQVI